MVSSRFHLSCSNFLRAPTRLGEEIQISADPLEFHRRHPDGSSVFGLRDGEVLLVNVHELDVIFAQAVRLSALEHEVDHIGRVLSLQGQDIVILSGTEHLGQGNQVDAQGDVAVAAVRGESFGLQHHRDQGNMGVVHGLQGDTGVIAVEVAILYEILDRIDDLSRMDGGQSRILCHLTPRQRIVPA